MTRGGQPNERGRRSRAAERRLVRGRQRVEGELQAGGAVGAGAPSPSTSNLAPPLDPTTKEWRGVGACVMRALYAILAQAFIAWIACALLP